MAELQAIPGFEVAPFPVVEEKIRELGLSLANPVEVRKLAQALEVDAVVIGAVTDFSPYYPPRCSMQVEWYTANPCFHPIPVGYGLPWGTPEEEYIPDSLVLETEMGLAREQLKTQTPELSADATIPVHDGERPKAGNLMALLSARDRKKGTAKGDDASKRTAAAAQQYPGKQLDHRNAASNDSVGSALGGVPEAPSDLAQSVGPTERQPPRPPGSGRSLQKRTADSRQNANLEALPGPIPPNSSAAPIAAVAGAPHAELPPDWPDPRGLVPPGPSPVCDVCRPTYEPVLRHTRAYNGRDVRFTAALESYAYFQDDARLGGWQSYLSRSDDFIRFCCHLHLTEMLTARGGAGETRVVWRWPERR
jgi:hypothetical protein